LEKVCESGPDMSTIHATRPDYTLIKGYAVFMSAPLGHGRVAQ
jgi:hypothetical protein